MHIVKNLSKTKSWVKYNRGMIGIASFNTLCTELLEENLIDYDVDG